MRACVCFLNCKCILQKLSYLEIVYGTPIHLGHPVQLLAAVVHDTDNANLEITRTLRHAVKHAVTVERLIPNCAPAIAQYFTLESVVPMLLVN